MIHGNSAKEMRKNMLVKNESPIVTSEMKSEDAIFDNSYGDVVL
jgi:hypothetical protein